METYTVLRDELLIFFSVSTLLNIHAFLPSENRVNSCAELKKNFLWRPLCIYLCLKGKKEKVSLKKCL